MIDGRVRINGATATNGDRVSAGDVVTLDGKPFALPASLLPDSSDIAASHIYLKYWKPRGVTCTTDARIPGNIIEALDHPGEERLFPVGRLDKDSEGLILLTNDGRLPNAINRAEHAHSKLYEVQCNRPIAEAHLRQLANGVVITTTAQRDKGPPKTLTAPTLPCDVRRTGSASFAITLQEGRNRQIRRMVKAVGGFDVVKLHRTSVMGIELSPELTRPGQWCELERRERRIVDNAIDQAEGGGGSSRAGGPQSPPQERSRRPQAAVVSSRPKQQQSSTQPSARARRHMGQVSQQRRRRGGGGAAPQPGRPRPWRQRARHRKGGAAARAGARAWRRRSARWWGPRTVEGAKRDLRFSKKPLDCPFLALYAPPHGDAHNVQ